jgi:hypothetical protein
MCRYVKYTNTTSQLMYVAQEHSIYGSSRVGVDNRKDTLYKAGSYSPAWGGANTFRRALGLKSFELANHLGNVLVTVSDKPVYKVSSGTGYFNPELTSASDYYPFGAPINGRGYASETYRFGFNTQEKIDEISGPGNHNTATFWEYDTRLGRRWNQDPKIVTGVSPYAINGDNPIFYTDPKGDFKKKWIAQTYNFFSYGGKGEVDQTHSGIHNGEWRVTMRDKRVGAKGHGIVMNEVVIADHVVYNLMGNPKRGGSDFSLAGMYAHFQFGGTSPMTLNMSSIDFSGTSQEELGLSGMKTGDVRPVNLFDAGPTNSAALAFGRVNMTYHGNNQFSIVSDKSSRFDFSPLYDPGASLGRNAGNILGTMINYNLMPGNPFLPLVPLIFGGPYNVNYNGTTTIPR